MGEKAGQIVFHNCIPNNVSNVVAISLLCSLILPQTLESRESSSSNVADSAVTRLATENRGVSEKLFSGGSHVACDLLIIVWRKSHNGCFGRAIKKLIFAAHHFLNYLLFAKWMHNKTMNERCYDD